MYKNIEKIPKLGLYEPETQFYPQHKVLIFGICKKNTLICSQLKF